MSDSTRRPQSAHSRREPPKIHRRRHWCCSLTTPPLSPEYPSSTTTSIKKPEIPFSPSYPQKLQLARRILSPGRVSPLSDIPLNQTRATSKSPLSEIISNDDIKSADFDVRLNLKEKNGGSLILELSSEVLCCNSSVFADLVADYRRNSSGLCRIEVPNVDNLNVFREVIELMFEEDVEKKLIDAGGFRVIDILEVSLGIKFSSGISSCLKYLEAVPWTEKEEERLKELFAKHKFNNANSTEILDRLHIPNSPDSQRKLTKQLISSVTNSFDTNARNEMKSLVKGLLSKSSVYEKNIPDLNKEDIFAICESCLSSLTTLFEEASSNEKDKPFLHHISNQVDNINWMVDILLDHQYAEKFVDLWAKQHKLLKLHETVSPIIRYEISRVSALLFIAMGTGKLHCRSESRVGVLQMWFKPMLADFGWLKRSKKGIDMKVLEETMGQVLLTLPLSEQYKLFMDWFQCFSKSGNECPNLSKTFQVWWRRSYLRGSDNFHRI